MGNLSDFQRLLNKHIEETSSSDTEYKLTENDKKNPPCNSSKHS